MLLLPAKSGITGKPGGDRTRRNGEFRGLGSLRLAFFQSCCPGPLGSKISVPVSSRAALETTRPPGHSDRTLKSWGGPGRPSRTEDSDAGWDRLGPTIGLRVAAFKKFELWDLSRIARTSIARLQYLRLRTSARRLPTVGTRTQRPSTYIPSVLKCTTDERSRFPSDDLFGRSKFNDGTTQTARVI